MKNTFLALLSALLLTPVLAAAQSQFASATITFNHQPRILLAYGDGESEVIPLQSLKVFAGIETREETWMKNQVTINKMLGDMAERGFEVISVKTNCQENTTMMYYLFEKRRDNNREPRREPLR